jgi:uncharacterized protein (TIGR03435 family)
VEEVVILAPAVRDCICIAPLLWASISPQAPLGQAFDVSSVKPAKPEILSRRGFLCGFGGGDRFMGLGTLQFFIACAYGIPAARASLEILERPKWVDEDLFEIAATAAPGTKRGSQSERFMTLRALLADRFKLAVHRERKEAPIYALVHARRDGTLGPQLRQTEADCAAWIAQGRQGAPPPISGDLPCGRGRVDRATIQGTIMTLQQFTNLLSPRVERPVEDRTGLVGTFNLKLEWSPDQSAQTPSGTGTASVPDDLPTSVFTALQEQLGLKLESTRSIVDVLVIDHVERPVQN